MAITSKILAPMLLLAFVSSTNLHAKVEKTPQRTRAVNLKDPNVLTRHFQAIKKSYRKGDISQQDTWIQLTRLTEHFNTLSAKDRASFLQIQSALLAQAGYPILASIYGSHVLQIAPNPFDAEFAPTWKLLRSVSLNYPIHSTLEVLAKQIKVPNGSAPAFGSEWQYFIANSASAAGNIPLAVDAYNKIEISNRYFFPAKYQQAIIEIDRNQFDAAETALKTILNPSVNTLTSVATDVQLEISDYAKMALGRLYYERQRFDESIKMYRSVSRKGANFYDALFEQSWAFFMAGYPMHALGALHAAESPFYQDVFNPEAPMLRSMVYYWLCNYDQSRTALADFMEHYKPAVESLADFLARKRLDNDQAYRLFENLLTGVSSESLGIPRAILKTAAETDSMLLIRDQYAALINEKNRLERKGIYGDKNSKSRPSEYLDIWLESLRKDIGSKYLAELQEIKKDYDRLFTQAEFLYVELLMSEKDQLLGKSLHASTKITHVNQTRDVKGWGNKTQAWKDSSTGEYWWDEVGFYITPVTSQCQVAQ